MDLRPDNVLLQEFVNNADDHAFTELVERHGGMVFSAAFAILESRSDAEDVTQAVFITLSKKAESLKKSTTIPGWLYHVSRNAALDWLRSEKRRRRREREAEQMKAKMTTTPDTDRELGNIVRDALDALPEKYSTPLIMHHMEGRTHAETAATLGITENAFSARLTRAREYMRKKLQHKNIMLSAALPLLGLGKGISTELSATVIQSIVLSAKAAKLGAGIGAAAGAGTSASAAGATSASTASQATASAAQVAKIVKGVEQMLLITKIKTATTCALTATALTFGTGAAYHLAASEAKPQKMLEREKDTAPTTTNAATDNVSFNNDPAVLGDWESVDFVSEIDNFSPETPSFRGEFFLKSFSFKPNGRTQAPWWTWEKGKVFHKGNKTTANYTIKNIEGKDYLFLEWISGDVTIHGMKPKYYVLTRPNTNVLLTALDRYANACKIVEADVIRAGKDDIVTHRYFYAREENYLHLTHNYYDQKTGDNQFRAIRIFSPGQLKSYLPLPKPRGEGSITRKTTTISNIRQAVPFILNVWGDFLATTIKRDSIKATNQIEIIDGHECQIFSASHNVYPDAFQYRIFCDPKLGYMPRAIESITISNNGEFVSRNVFSDFREVNGLQFPMQAIETTPNREIPRTYNVYKIQSLLVNDRIDTPLFKLDFPGGTKVVDEELKTEQIVRGAGKGSVPDAEKELAINTVKEFTKATLNLDAAMVEAIVAQNSLLSGPKDEFMYKLNKEKAKPDVEDLKKEKELAGILEYTVWPMDNPPFKDNKEWQTFFQKRRFGKGGYLVVGYLPQNARFAENIQSTLLFGHRWWARQKMAVYAWVTDNNHKSRVSVWDDSPLLPCIMNYLDNPEDAAGTARKFMIGMLSNNIADVEATLSPEAQIDNDMTGRQVIEKMKEGQANGKPWPEADNDLEIVKAAKYKVWKAGKEPFADNPLWQTNVIGKRKFEENTFLVVGYIPNPPRRLFYCWLEDKNGRFKVVGFSDSHGTNQIVAQYLDGYEERRLPAIQEPVLRKADEIKADLPQNAIKSFMSALLSGNRKGVEAIALPDAIIDNHPMAKVYQRIEEIKANQRDRRELQQDRVGMLDKVKYVVWPIGKEPFAGNEEWAKKKRAYKFGDTGYLVIGYMPSNMQMTMYGWVVETDTGLKVGGWNDSRMLDCIKPHLPEFKGADSDVF